VCYKTAWLEPYLELSQSNRNESSATDDSVLASDEGETETRETEGDVKRSSEDPWVSFQYILRPLRDKYSIKNTLTFSPKAPKVKIDNLMTSYLMVKAMTMMTLALFLTLILS
jgi:hypothetical protein